MSVVIASDLATLWQIFLEELLLVAADFSLRVLKNRRLKPAATGQYKSIT